MEKEKLPLKNKWIDPVAWKLIRGNPEEEQIAFDPTHKFIHVIRLRQDGFVEFECDPPLTQTPRQAGLSVAIVGIASSETGYGAILNIQQ